MAGQYTFSMIKPDATSNKASCARRECKSERFDDTHLVNKGHKGSLIGQIVHMIENSGFEIVGQKMLVLTPSIAESFYDVHRDKGFFKEMIDAMLKGPIIAQVLKKENAVQEYRDLIGATDPKNASSGTIRYAFGLDLGQNSVHGSDSDENAEREIDFFFARYELIL